MVEQNMSMEDIARSVLAQYDVAPVKIQIIQQGGIKTVWRIILGKDELCLKRLNKSLDKAIFSVEAQKYIKANGGLVPGIIDNKQGKSITEYNNELFVLYEWVDGKQLNFNVEEDFKAAMEGLALFHKCSQGYEPPQEARVSTKLSKWPEQYRSMLNRMNEWKNTAHQNAGVAIYNTYLTWIDPIIALGERAIQYLERSRYGELSCLGSSSVVLCHQDFGKGNALLTPKGVYVLDLDGVTFELAARDLRKIILKTMENQSGLNERAMKNIIAWYEKGNMLSVDEKKMVYIDSLFPHGFFGCVKNQFIKNKSVKASSIEQIAQLELSKQNILGGLIEGEET